MGKSIVSQFQTIPREELPRERLLQYGEKSLSNQELLAILFRTGSRHESVLELARRFLQKFDHLNAIKRASIEEYQSIQGIGPTKAIELKAAIELGTRISSSTIPRYGQLSSTQQAGAWFVQEMSDLQQEHLMVLFLTSKNEVIRKQTIFMGSVNTSVAHPREIFKEAVKYPTARMLIAHNHPSGNYEPSPADWAFTRRMIACGEMMGIELLDHLIIGENAYYSLREESRIFDEI
ncbi:RadC family protein [Facklamia lactis]|uniref:RadC family protein n=1 Tax=Facklamia lactis TaxID=2749967 RepID=UPI003F696275